MVHKQTDDITRDPQGCLRIYEAMNTCCDGLMEIGKIRALVVQQTLEEYKDRPLEEICREAFCSRFGGEGPVDLCGALIRYLGGKGDLPLNTMGCSKADTLTSFQQVEDVLDYVSLWLFAEAPEPMRNDIITPIQSSTIYGNGTSPETLDPVPYVFSGYRRVHSKYVFLGDPDLLDAKEFPLTCMLDALFTPGLPEKKRVAALRRCPLGLTRIEEARVRTLTRRIQAGWEKLAVWMENDDMRAG